MRTNIVIDDELINEAMALSQIKTKRAVVETGLRLLVQIKKQERIKNFRGKLKSDIKYNGGLPAACHRLHGNLMVGDRLDFV